MSTFERDLLKVLNKIADELHEENKLSKEAIKLSEQSMINSKHQTDLQDIFYASYFGDLNEEQVESIANDLIKRVENAIMDGK